MRFHDLIGYISDLIPCAAQAAADATSYIAIWRAPYKCRVTAMAWVPSTATTGNNTNRRNFNVDLAAGTEQANVDLATGVDLVAGTAKAIAITTTAGYINLEEGDTLLLESEKVSSGVAVGLGAWQVTYQGN